MKLEEVVIMKIFKKVLVASCLTSSILHADTFSLSSIKKDASGNISEKGLKVKNTKEIISTGYGKNKEQALNNAFKSAIQQYVGVVVDSESIMKNGALIKDNILTASNGFIKSYDVISSSIEDGLVETQIKAIVESQKIFSKIKSLKINTISFQSEISGKNLKAEIETKQQSKKDSAKILKKAMDKFFSTSSIQDMLDLKILNVKLLKDSVKENKIPMVINYRLALNYNVYAQKVNELEQTFKSLGIKLHSRVDLPYLKNNRLKIKNRTKVKKLTATDFGIIKKYGQGYKLDVWSFPRNWKDVYPFNSSKSINFKKLFQIILELKDTKSNVILADRLKVKFNYYLLSSKANTSYYYYEFSKDEVKILNPLISTNDVYLDFSNTQMIDLENIDKVKDISIELEEK